MPGGYCASTCEGCDATCVETRGVTPPAAYCLAACTDDAACRVDEGYLCDPAFHACVLPNSTPIVPRDHCPVGGQDAFGVATPTGEMTIERVHDDPAVAAAQVGDCGACTDPGVVRRGANVVVAYTLAHGIRVRGSSDGGTNFRAAVTAVPGAYGDLAIGDRGSVHVVALDGSLHGAYGSAMHRIVYAGSRDGGRTFGPPVVVSGRDESIPFVLGNPMIALDERRGRLYVVYVRGDRSAVWDVVLATSKDRGVTWTRTTIGDGCALHALPAIAVDPTTGTVHVAYYVDQTFARTTCTPGATRCTRRGAIGPSAFTTARFGRDWLGQRASLEIDARARTIRATWVAPQDGIARVMTATAKLSP